VLGVFHESLLATKEPPGAGRARLLDITAEEVTRDLGLDDGEFLPFAAAWPQVRDGYLAWLARHEAKEGAKFERAESEHEMQLGPVKLVGRIDRIDRLADGHLMVMDYKTEARSSSADRVKQPGEDTQLAFYAALLHDDTLRAAYINVGERGKTETLEQEAVVEARDLLVLGILDDVRRIGDGEPLPALGEGKVCEFCSARGLCRRDFWS
jgi:ATP-dependent helicase/nuclease subunit B